MKETLLKKVKPETLEKLLSAFGDVLDEIKDAVPNKNERLRDELYTSLLVMNYDAFQTLRWQAEETRGQRDCRITGSPERRAGAAGTAGKLVNRK